MDEGATQVRMTPNPRAVEPEDPGYGTTRITGTFEVTIDYVLGEGDMRTIRRQVLTGLQERLLDQWGGGPRLVDLDVRGRVDYEVVADKPLPF
jgi:hypothetical protein